MSTRGEIARLRARVEALEAAASIGRSEFVRDPARLMEAAGMTPDAWQREVLETTDDALLLVSRQAGKSTVTASLGLHMALSKPESLTLIIAPVQRQSVELFEKVKAQFRAAGSPLPLENDALTYARFVNGSRILTLPGKASSIRGYTPDLVIIDEAAWVLDDVYQQAVRPMFAVGGGRLVALTTPFGRRGWFHQEWTENAAAWHRIKVTAGDCPRIRPEFLEAERRRLPLPVYQSEYWCEFVGTTADLFLYDDLVRAFNDGAPMLYPGGIRPGMMLPDNG